MGERGYQAPRGGSIAVEKMLEEGTIGVRAFCERQKLRGHPSLGYWRGSIFCNCDERFLEGPLRPFEASDAAGERRFGLGGDMDRFS
jgi:hypothetical protein